MKLHIGWLYKHEDDIEWQYRKYQNDWEIGEWKHIVWSEIEDE